jgi:hypothetical protein
VVYVVPVVDMFVHVPATKTRTDDGAKPFASLTRTEKLKVVAVVPDPGDAVPFQTASGPQGWARTGPAVQTSDATTKPASANARPTLVI